MSRWNQEFGRGSWDQLEPTQRLQPYLLDRLTRDPERPEADTARTLEEFKQCIRRDLSWLLNAKRPIEAEYLESAFPLLASSAMNYGIPILSGQSVVSLTTDHKKHLEQLVRTAIQRFEPRLKSTALKVRVLEPGAPGSTETASTCIIEMVIEGDAVALPERLVLQTKFNVATGLCDEVRENEHAALGR